MSLYDGNHCSKKRHPAVKAGWEGNESRGSDKVKGEPRVTSAMADRTS